MRDDLRLLSEKYSSQIQGKFKNTHLLKEDESLDRWNQHMVDREKANSNGANLQDFWAKTQKWLATQHADVQTSFNNAVYGAVPTAPTQTPTNLPSAEATPHPAGKMATVGNGLA